MLESGKFKIDQLSGFGDETLHVSIYFMARDKQRHRLQVFPVFWEMI